MFLLYRAGRNFRRGKYIRSIIYTLIPAVIGCFFWEAYFRIRETKYITLQNGKTLCIRTFRETDPLYYMDVNDVRIDPLTDPKQIFLADAGWEKHNDLTLFNLIIDDRHIYNSELFITVIGGRKYLNYLDEYQKL